MLSEHNPEWTIGNAIKWNFTKFLINKQGKVISRYEPTDDIDLLRRDIDRLLQE
ncbi:Hydroperoxy fatty acid reductase gpx1 [compost metagenome]